MLLRSLIIAVALAASPPEPPILVTGHKWAPFISPFGEPFRARKPDEDTMADWFHQADQDKDGRLTLPEMISDSARFFAHLDTDGNRQIEPDELIRYEWELAPEIQVGARWRRSSASSAQVGPATSTAPASAAPASVDPADRGKRGHRLDPGRDNRGSDGSEYALQGAARYALINLPEPVAAADADFDRAVTAAEFRQAAIERFALLDRGRKGALTLTDLEALRPPQFVPGSIPKRRAKGAADTRVGSPLPAGN